ncbi:MAG: transposase [Planctomycetaceae bacterium]|nr:transposase [Planctomycetaceae bacterium]
MALVDAEVVEEDPQHTSQRCSRCSHTERDNRPKQSLFKCQRCGIEVHSDLNAARNLATRHACSPGVGDVIAPLSGEARCLVMVSIGVIASWEAVGLSRRRMSHASRKSAKRPWLISGKWWITSLWARRDTS